MYFLTPLLAVLSLSATPILAQDASASSVQASLSSMEASIQASASAIVASAESMTASLESAASSAIYSLTHCNPSFASWYHSITSVLATETNLASISSIENSLYHSAVTGACTAPVTNIIAATGATATVASANPTGTATSSPVAASTGEAALLAPALSGMSAALVVAVAAWL